MYSGSRIEVCSLQSLFPCPVGKGLFFLVVERQPVFRTQKQIPVFVRNNTIDIVCLQAAVVGHAVCDFIRLIINDKQSVPVGADIGLFQVGSIVNCIDTAKVFFFHVRIQLPFRFIEYIQSLYGSYPEGIFISF